MSKTRSKTAFPRRQRLILGCINHYLPEKGWENVHADLSSRDLHHPTLGTVPVDHIVDAAHMHLFKTGRFDEVRMWHTLEHLTAKRAAMAVGEVARVLKPGGVFDVEVPDLDRLCRAWIGMGTVTNPGSLEYTREGLLQWFYSEDVEGVLPDPDLNAHRSGWNEDLLGAVLREHGFDPGDRLESGLALRYRAVKSTERDS